tara:strand:- start:1766 stop:2227 length:462 start_codon:yes stop_codon:yes gene_type:complete
MAHTANFNWQFRVAGEHTIYKLSTQNYESDVMRWLAILFSFGLPATNAAAQDIWRLDAASATCILANIEGYRQSSENPVVIFVKACPIVDRAAAIQSMQQNSALPTLKEGTTGAFGVDEVIVFTRKELACLANLVVPPNAPIIGLPKNPRCNG